MGKVIGRHRTQWDRELQLPEVKSFVELYDPTKKGERYLLDGGEESLTRPTTVKYMVVSSYITVKAGNGCNIPTQSLYYYPTDLLFNYVRDKMVYIDYDTMYVEVIVFCYKRTYTGTVYVRHNKIIGSRVLCELNMKTLPGFVTKEPKP
jgi:hypothetical protein